MRVLVTGGAGYIGAHVVRALQHEGHDVAVLDDMSTGSRDRLMSDVPFFLGSVLDTTCVTEALGVHGAQAVVHLAGKKAVEESVTQPLEYYRENVIGTHSLLSAMVAAAVGNILFSSSAAVYGVPPDGMVTEESPTVPASPYGWTKLICEQMIRDTAAAKQLNWAALRYFNVGGAVEPRLGDRGENNLIPMVFRAVRSGVNPRIFGVDHPTPDGTCIRDYIHVHDVAAAHAAVIARMGRHRLGTTYNIGTGAGTSVLEVMSMVRQVTGIDFRWDSCAPRAGDPSEVVADPTRIKSDLGWQSTENLEGIIASAWDAWSTTLVR